MSVQHLFNSFAECRYAEFCYADGCYAGCDDAECRYLLLHFAECRGTHYWIVPDHFFA